MPASNLLPVTLVSGFLGAGKTTLLRRVLAAGDPRRVAVLENELGEQPVADELPVSLRPGLLTVVRGRSCCETREAFIRQLYAVAAETERFDRLVIETSGVAHPGMLAAMFLADSALRYRLRLDGIVTIVDAANYEAHAGQEGHADEQIAYADAVVLNKSDLVSAEELTSPLAAVRRLNGKARIFVTSQVRAPIDELLNLGGFDFARVENGVGGCREVDRTAGAHRHEIETVTIQCPGNLEFDRFRAWFEGFLGRHARDLFRAKGVLAVHGSAERLLIQTVHGCCRVATGPRWGSQQRGSSLVLIGRNLPVPALQRGLLSCVVASVETGEWRRSEGSAQVSVAGPEAAS